MREFKTGLAARLTALSEMEIAVAGICRGEIVPTENEMAQARDWVKRGGAPTHRACRRFRERSGYSLDGLCFLLGDTIRTKNNHRLPAIVHEAYYHDCLPPWAEIAADTVMVLTKGPSND